ncbi:RNA polymerase sigma factor [Myroides sp. LJL115]
MKKTIVNQIALAKQSDQSAFTFLLDHYWSEVYYFILQRINNEADAEDITIETFSKAFSSIQSYNDKFSFNTWLIAIAKNVHIDLVRKRKKDGLLMVNTENHPAYNNIADDTANMEDLLIKQQNLAVFKSYVKLLKPHYQEVIELRFFQELSYNEIATITGQPLNNVKVKLIRARRLLQEIILKQIDSNFTI